LQTEPPSLTRNIAPICVALLVLIAVAVAALSLRWTVMPSQPSTRIAAARHAPTAVPRPTEPPPAIEPLVLLEMTPDRARAINAAIPFVAGNIAPARPFILAGSPADRERALTCLAAAVWYEAGDDPVGQRAVAQVVLNRVRHPAYPKTVCGVVFQGSERRTGCQFTFTCDGAMTRTPSPEAWQRARGIAEKALAGTVEKVVGTATHYHTDWVVPYWSGSLDKIAEVHTHLFFRWPGWWGQPGAFSGRYSGGETLDPRLASLAGEAAAAPAALTQTAEAMSVQAIAAEGPAPKNRPALDVPGVAPASLKGNIVRLANDSGTEFGLELDRNAFPGSFAVVAYALCKAKPACIVAGWLRPELIPAALPVPLPALRTVSFLYRKNVDIGRDQAFWNCRQLARDDPAQCLPGTEATRE
jgi:spore germination cell wall hydrolase CwlJ-like protein